MLFCVTYCIENHFSNSQPENIKSLCSKIVDTLKRECPQLVEEGASVANKYEKLFTLFGACHFKYNSIEPMKDDEVTVLGINNFKNFHYRAT